MFFKYSWSQIYCFFAIYKLLLVVCPCGLNFQGMLMDIKTSFVLTNVIAKIS